MKSVLRLTCLLLCAIGLPIALSACQEEKKAAHTGTAEGEILPGSASDAMLPYDTVRSQPPLAPLPVATGKAGKKGSGDDAAAEGSEAADDGPGDEPNEDGAAPTIVLPPPKAAPAE